MPFNFIHYIDDFIEIALQDNKISFFYPDDYFGSQLSHSLLKKFKITDNTINAIHLNSRNLNFQTLLPEKETLKLQSFYSASLNIIKQKNINEVKVIDFYKPHISWIFLGHGNKDLFNRLYKNIKNFTDKKSKLLDFCLETNLRFKGTDYFEYSKQEISEFKKNSKNNNSNSSLKGLIYLKPDLDTSYKANNIFNELTKILKINDYNNFSPHISIARIKNMKIYNEELKHDFEKIWQECEINFTPNNFILFRNIGKYKNQPIFGFQA